MTHSPDKLEAVARAILRARFYDCEPEMYESLDAFYKIVWQNWSHEVLDEAQAAIDALSPLYAADVSAAVAAETAIWTQAIETYFDATAVMDVETHVAAIRKAEGRV